MKFCACSFPSQPSIRNYVPTPLGYQENQTFCLTIYEHGSQKNHLKTVSFFAHYFMKPIPPLKLFEMPRTDGSLELS
jgi:hypothetical protein